MTKKVLLFTKTTVSKEKLKSQKILQKSRHFNLSQFYQMFSEKLYFFILSQNVAKCYKIARDVKIRAKKILCIAQKQICVFVTKNSQRRIVAKIVSTRAGRFVWTKSRKCLQFIW